MFNTKENSSSGILNDSELLYFDEILENNLYENIIVFLHHHPVLLDLCNGHDGYRECRPTITKN